MTACRNQCCLWKTSEADDCVSKSVVSMWSHKSGNDKPDTKSVKSVNPSLRATITKMPNWKLDLMSVHKFECFLIQLLGLKTFLQCLMT